MTCKRKSTNGLNRRDVLKYGFYGSLVAGLPQALWLSGCRKPRPGKKRPDVILVSVDTLRPDHLTCYGYSRDTSPDIDRLASESLLFEKCFSHAPSTGASLASLLSGFLPHETKVTNKTILSAGVEMLPEILRGYGYKTAAVVSNYVLRENRGWEQGFDVYDAKMKQRELNRNMQERTAEHTTDSAIKLLKRFQKDNLFLWIHYQDPHGPYIPPKRFADLFHSPGQKPRNLRLNTTGSGQGGIPAYQKLGTNRDFHHYVSQYDGEIRYQDEHFKRLIGTLKKLDLYNDSLIIFTSDHGEGMGEHDYYFAHGENLYNILTHVPLIIKYGTELAGRRTDFVRHIDVVPTILNILDIEPNPLLRGYDLRTKQPADREIFAKMETAIGRDKIKFSILTDGFKLIYTPLHRKYELFDVQADYKEEHDLIDKPGYERRAEHLKAELKQITGEDLLQLGTIKSPALTDEELEILRSLGYVE
jgi:arylsulfatase A-like enzyme